MLFANNFLDLFVLSAPWLILGFFIAACFKAFVETEFLHRHLGGQGLWVTVKAALIGAPLPLCSCGVVPAALGLREAGASKPATVSFLIATPETGVDSVALTNALMGPFLAVFRPIAAVVSAVVAGVLVGVVERFVPDDVEPIAIEDKKPSCCASQESNSCSSKETLPVSKESITQRLKTGMQFSFGKMLRDIVNWLLIGLVVAALMQSFLPDEFFASLGQGFLPMLVMALIGIPMYVCATASTPIAAGFLIAGLSPGAVLVFMLLGPASNIGTIAIIKKELGKASVIAYLIGVTSVAFGFGYLLDYLVNLYQWDLSATMMAHAHDDKGIVDYISAIALALLMLRALYINKVWQF